MAPLTTDGPKKKFYGIIDVYTHGHPKGGGGADPPVIILILCGVVRQDTDGLRTDL